MRINENYIECIESKMNKLHERQYELMNDICTLDIGLHDKEVLSILSFTEYLKGVELIRTKEMELIRVKKQYKNLNQIRLHALGLI